MRRTLACIVEGHGDVASLPLLVRRIAEDSGHYNVDVPTPIRCHKSKIVRPSETIHKDELERAIKLAIYKLPSPEHGAVLILLDADDDCPAEIGPEIVRIAHEIRPDICAKVVIAKREYEAWFIAAMESLRGYRGIRADAIAPRDPESIADPKGYLNRYMPEGKRYSETLDQPALTSVFSFAQAERCDSFRKLRRDLEEILRHLFRNHQT